MKFSEFLRKGEEDKQIPVILGNGPTEVKLLRYLAQRVNGTDCSIADTRTSLPLREKKTGPHALETLSVLIHLGFRLRRALYIVDKEHIPDIKVILEKLTEYGFSIEEYKEIERRVGVLRIRKGHRELALYMVIAGEEKNLDEELVSLAQLVYGRDVKVNYIKGRIRELIRRARIEQISRTIKLYKALKMIEQECKRVVD